MRWRGKEDLFDAGDVCADLTLFFRFSLVGAPPVNEPIDSTGSKWSDSEADDGNEHKTVASTASNSIEWDSILPDIRTLFTGISLG